MHVDVLKSILVIVLFFLTFLCCISPIGFRRLVLRQESEHSLLSQRTLMLVFSLLSCFGGGVFLATCLLDLMVETLEKLQQLQVKTGSDFPLAEFFIACGFFIILIMEQLVVWWKEHKASEVYTEPEVARPISGDESRPSIEGVTGRPRPKYSTGSIGRSAQSYGAIDSSTEIAVNNPSLNDDESIAIHFDPESHSTLRALLLVFALSLHTFFEGMALGLQSDSKAALQIFGALCIHKAIIGFSLGLRLVQSKLPITAIVLCCLVFSFVMAFGAVIGIVISSELASETGDILNGALQGVATGTFLYVTFFEVLPHELNPRGHRIGKLLMLIFGFGTVATLVMLMPGA